jgi:uncharacterized OB-fold protein
MNIRPADWTEGEPRIVLTRCGRCGNRWYLPQEHCIICGSDDTATSPAAGGGLCVAVTRVHVTTSGRAEGTSALALALVELDEGPLVMGRVHDEALTPGARARVTFHERDEGTGLVPSFGREGRA